jgi:metallo-beta-lactamase class B
MIDAAITPTEIFDGVYIIGTRSTVIYVLRTTAGLMMIDALGDADGPTTDAQRAALLLPGFARLGLDPMQVKLILLTHGHADHWGGARYFQLRIRSRGHHHRVRRHRCRNSMARSRTEHQSPSAT